MVENEKRRQTRVPVEDEICIMDLTTGKELGILANINADGFMLIGDEGLKEDRFYDLSINLEPTAEGGEIVIGAECLWISETGTGDQVWAGFQITEVSELGGERIDRLIEQYK